MKTWPRSTALRLSPCPGQDCRTLQMRRRHFRPPAAVSWPSPSDGATAHGAPRRSHALTTWYPYCLRPPAARGSLRGPRRALCPLRPALAAALRGRRSRSQARLTARARRWARGIRRLDSCPSTAHCLVKYSRRHREHDRGQVSACPLLKSYFVLKHERRTGPGARKDHDV